MRRLTLLTWTPLLAAAALVGCTRDNPAFDDLAEGTSTGDGDGDPGDGDGDPGDGDGDGESGDGDGDGESGDGDGDGDGDGESGDGDGDGDPNALPTCPETTLLKLPVVKDTFLVAAPEEGNTCIVAWDWNLWMPKFADTQTPCEMLTFGGAPEHWVCSNPNGCSSVWLGRFDVGGFADQAPKVMSAQVEFSAQVDSGEGNQVMLLPLEVDPTVFGQCGDWSPGTGWGAPVSDCKTTYTHAAYPHAWSVDGLVGNAAVLGASQIPAGELFEHDIIMPIANSVVEGWMNNQPLHLGVLLRSQSWTPTEFVLHAQESDSPPQLAVEVCSQL